MGIYGFAVTATACLSVSSAAFSQGFNFGTRGFVMQPVYEGRSVSRTDCDQLRWACAHEAELKEEGVGNCQEYRRTCRRY